MQQLSKEDKPTVSNGAIGHVQQVQCPFYSCRHASTMQHKSTNKINNATVVTYAKEGKPTVSNGN